MMANRQQGSVVSLFMNHHDARGAVDELRARGFGIEDVGIASRDWRQDLEQGYSELPTHAPANKGFGSLWGLGIVVGIMPLLGPAIAGGTLSPLLKNPAEGAVPLGFTQTLERMGVPRDDAAYFGAALESGRIVVTVLAGDREAEVSEVMDRFGGIHR
jgi:hypothetical protein